MTSALTDRAPRWAAWLFAAMTLTLLVYAVDLLFIPDSAEVSALVQKFGSSAIFFGAAALCVLKAQSTQRERSEWHLFAGAMLLWGSASTYYSLVLWDVDPVPVPSVADILWVAFYVPAYLAISGLSRKRAGTFGRAAWLDGLIGVLGVGGAAALMVFGTILEHASGSAIGVLTDMAYPIGDLGLVALVVGAMTMLGWSNSGVLRWIAPAFVLFAGADALYGVQVAQGTYTAGGIVDLGWPLAALLVGLGAWRAESPPSADARIRPVIGVPEFVGVASVVVLVVDHFTRTSAAVIVLSSASLIAILLRLHLTVRENEQLLETSTQEAMTDALTGLGNRRQLAADLDLRVDRLTASRPLVLTLFDLDGFKQYNDTFGHPAGDQLLTRLGANLSGLVAGFGGAYRMGGDEFCTLWNTWDANIAGVSAADAAAALTETGEGFNIECSYGSVSLPEEAAEADAALGLADHRMYTEKNGGRISAGRQSADVLQRALIERDALLADHVSGVADLAVATAARLRVPLSEQELTAQVALLHDIGKVAIPDAVLDKPGSLDEDEWTFMKQHTIIGERILSAAPALEAVGRLVRSTHEAFDGRGYPDGLAGEDIPLIARIVAVCDAYEAMTAPRCYRVARPGAEAVAELRRCAGGQFDPRVVEAFVRALGAGALERPDLAVAVLA